MEETIVRSGEEGIRLDRWFKRNFPETSFILIAKLTRLGKIRINGKKVDVSERLKRGEKITFPQFNNDFDVNTVSKNQSHALELKYSNLAKEIIANILYYDNDIIAINKAAGLATQGGTKVSVSVDSLTPFLKLNSTEKPRLVHRLDKETSGALLLARSANSASIISELMRKREISKRYLAILCGVPKEKNGIISLPLIKKDVSNDSSKSYEYVCYDLENGKEAVTKYRVIDYSAMNCLVELETVTGRMHQIRAHCAAIGCPILGDRKYAKASSDWHQENSNIAHLKQNNSIEKAVILAKKSKNIHLHSWKISLMLNNKNINITASLPLYFENTMKEWGFIVR